MRRATNAARNAGDSSPGPDFQSWLVEATSAVVFGGGIRFCPVRGWPHHRAQRQRPWIRPGSASFCYAWRSPPPADAPDATRVDTQAAIRGVGWQL